MSNCKAAYEIGQSLQDIMRLEKRIENAIYPIRLLTCMLGY